MILNDQKSGICEDWIILLDLLIPKFCITYYYLAWAQQAFDL